VLSFESADLGLVGDARKEMLAHDVSLCHVLGHQFLEKQDFIVDCGNCRVGISLGIIGLHLSYLFYQLPHLGLQLVTHLCFVRRTVLQFLH
jgi:hypothetical protein